MVDWTSYPDVDHMSRAAAGRICSRINAALRHEHTISLALPGGSTPQRMLEELTRKETIPWERITLFTADEHLRGAGSVLENGARLGRLFGPLGANVTPLLPPGWENLACACAGDAADARLQSVPWPPALACLGIGEDGHTASLLPGAEFEAAMSLRNPRRFVGLHPDPMPASAPFHRITITAAGLCTAGLLMILAIGPEKRRVLEHALAEIGAGEAKMPIARVIAQARCPVKVLWSP